MKANECFYFSLILEGNYQLRISCFYIVVSLMIISQRYSSTAMNDILCNLNAVTVSIIPFS